MYRLGELKKNKKNEKWYNNNNEQYDGIKKER